MILKKIEDLIKGNIEEIKAIIKLYKMKKEKRLQEDWRARVRGLERVASALRTSSALIAIEPRLGSLLHAVLGCERSCRVAAAGLAVAKVTRKYAWLNQF